MTAGLFPTGDSPADAVFWVPACGASLVYAPLHGVVAVVSGAARRRLTAALDGEWHDSDGERRDDLAPLLGGRLDGQLVDGQLGEVARRLRRSVVAPRPRDGPLTEPLFLGIVPTRACSLACGYCDFGSTGASTAISLDLAEAAVDAYLVLLREAGAGEGQIHFFGGEPFHAGRAVEFVVEYAGLRAAEAGVRLRFEVTTNGMVGVPRAQWIADRFDTVVLSLDGPPDVQDRQRPTLSGAPSSPTVLRTAGILAEGAASLVVRSCVTADTVEDLPRWAAWVCGTLHPDALCLEPLTPSAASVAAGRLPPDPYRFAENVARAGDVLARHGARAVHAMSETSPARVTLCPVGRDALIVLPDGRVAGCYLPPERWHERDLDLFAGRVDVARRRFAIDPVALAAVRGLPARDKPLCAGCFCRFHCAGGCHVQHSTARPAGQYDDQCLATRLLSAHRLLREVNLSELADRCLADPDAAVALARHPDDRLLVGQDDRLLTGRVTP